MKQHLPKTALSITYFLFFWLGTLTLNAQMISTIVGTGVSGNSGNGGPANLASLTLNDIAFDKKGNMYISDRINMCIKKVSKNGIITTVVGNYNLGFSGDGGLAINAKINNPYGVSVAPNGDIIVLDWGNSCVRRVDSAGIITTIAGQGTISGNSGNNGLATNATLHMPNKALVDKKGNIYISDGWNMNVRKVDTNGIITLFAGTSAAFNSGDGGLATQAGVYDPWGLDMDSKGNIYISCFNGHCIRKVDTTGIISTVCGNGIMGYTGDGALAVNAQLNFPTNIKIDANDEIYIADYGNRRIRKIDANGIITTFAGDGTLGFKDNCSALTARFNNPSGIDIDDCGNVYIADNGNFRVRKITTNSNCVLPLTFLSFEATPLKADLSQVNLVWKVSNEINTNHFEIQRKLEKGEFEKIADVKSLGSGDNRYQFLDKSASNNDKIYRIKSIDNNGDFLFSKEILVKSSLHQQFSISPNPAKDFIQLKFDKNDHQSLIVVYDITGKVVIEQSIPSNEASWKLNTEKFTNGLYTIQLLNNMGSNSSKFLIEK